MIQTGYLTPWVRLNFLNLFKERLDQIREGMVSWEVKVHRTSREKVVVV